MFAMRCKSDMLSLPVSPGASRFSAISGGLPAGPGNLPVFNETQTKNMNFAERSWKIIRIVTFQFMLKLISPRLR